MPLVFVWPLLAGGAGFTAGFFSGNSLWSVFKIAALGAIGFWLYGLLA